MADHGPESPSDLVLQELLRRVANQGPEEDAGASVMPGRGFTPAVEDAYRGWMAYRRLFACQLVTTAIVVRLTLEGLFRMCFAEIGGFNAPLLVDVVGFNAPLLTFPGQIG